MEVQLGPGFIDEPSLLYKLQRKIKVFDTNDPLPNRGYNLVASSSKYGLVFVAVPDGTLSVYQLSQLVDKECEPQHLSVKLLDKPTHIAVSCDYELLAVTSGKFLSIYKVGDFQNPNVSPSFSIKTEGEPSTNPSYVSALQWNPCIPDSIVIAYYDGTLLACHANTGQVKKVTGRARCICWSPKGKQLVTGNSDGTLIQYKPELTAAKLVQAPNLFNGAPVEAIAIYWISTYQFAVVYKNAADNSCPAVTIVNTPKAGQPSCVSYEDICCSIGLNRPWYYLLQGLAQWNIIMAASSNSMEIGTLCALDGTNWVHWCQSDEARPELPLTDKKVENYPVGMSIDTCAIHQLPWGENEILPHMPLLHVISQKGILTTFNVINMRREAMQLCSPPQHLVLPAQAMTSLIPGAAPPSAPTPVPVASRPEILTSLLTQPAVSAPQAAQPASAAQLTPQTSVSVSATIKIPSFTPQNNEASTASTNQPEQRGVETIRVVAETTTGPPPPTQVTVAQPKPQPQPQPAAAKPQTNAALQADQEKASRAKANQELKDMLVKEVNDFQTELYNFMVKTKETQARLQRDIDTISTNFNKGIPLDTEELKKECSMEELRGAIVQLKLELVRACAVVAEARTHSDAKDLHQWSQADPLTTKRVASVKKLAYYVQSQLAQAHAALDYKWNEMASRGSQDNKHGKRMIRPILDDVYQPLVKQQEILSRQEAVLRTLKSTLAECDVGPVFKSTSLLRSTPFRNNKDPLSKLTKNILNMSLEPETKPKRNLLTPSKLDALREVLSNHKTVKIKPVNVELTQHLETLKKNYEKGIKEKAEKVEALPPPAKMVKITAKPPKPEPAKQPAASFTPVSNAKPTAGPSSVVRTLFTDEPKREATAPQPVIPRPVSNLFDPPTTPKATVSDTKSVLKDVITNRQANLEAKNNTFMGQKICSPTAFSQQSAPTPSSAPSAVFTSKPITEITNMFNKIQPQPFIPELKSTLNARQTDKPTPSTSNIKSSETGEPEDSGAPKQKPMTNLFALKTPLAASTPVPGTSKTIEQKITKPLEKLTEKTKENVPERAENVPITVTQAAEKKEAKSSQGNKSFVFGDPQANEASASASSGPKPLALKVEPQKGPEKSNAASSASSIFASANASISTPKPLSAFVAPSTSISTEPITPTDSKPSPTLPSAVSIFGAAVASQPKTNAFSATSVFTSTPSTVVFGTSPGLTTTQGLVPRTITTTGSIFEPVSTSQPDRPKAQPANSGGSIFKPVLQPSTSDTASEATTTASAFGSSTVTIKSIFGSAASTPLETTSTTASIFGSTPSVAKTAATVSIFSSATVASTTTTASVFGSAMPGIASTTTTASVFSSSPSVPSTTTGPGFGSSTSSLVTATSAFGSTSPSVVSVFGATTTAPTASTFGSIQTPFASTDTASAFTPTTTSIFGATTQASSVFAQAAQSAFGATTQASIFGPTTQASVFSPTTPTPVFGSSSTTQASIFGSPTQTTQTSIFGTPTATTQASVFGTPTQASSVFGTPTQTTQASVFGTPTQTSQTSIFGQPATTVQSGGSLFGGGEANLFAAASISTTNASTPSSGGNIFGGSPGSVFGGGGTNVFGGKSAFGQPNPAATNIFGGGASFGQKPATNFWGSGNTTQSGFGSSGFGQPATTQASSIFGGTTGGSFSQPSAGAFSGSPQPTAFGSPTQQQQQASAFGGGAVFGSKSLFGQPPGFGSPTGAGFGSPAAFGGFNKSPGGSAFAAPAFGGGTPFGGGSPGGGFSPATQSNATFESLATQNTLTFGNLAQQSGSPQPAAPSFNTSPSFTGWRG